MPKQFHPLRHRADRTAGGVAHHHNQRGMQMGNRVFNAAEDLVVDDISSYPDDE